MKRTCSAALGGALVFVAFAMLWTAPRAEAQSYPARAIRDIVPASVSTPPDIVSRIVVNAINVSEGWNVVVENRPGAGQVLGAREALKQPADGYTFLTVGFPLTVTQSLVPDAGFDLNSDLAPIAQLVTTGNVLVVNPKVPATTVAELVQYLKDNPDKGTFSSGGVGTPAHIIGELFKLKTGGAHNSRSLHRVPARHRGFTPGRQHVSIHRRGAGARLHQVRSAARARGHSGQTLGAIARRADAGGSGLS